MTTAVEKYLDYFIRDFGIDISMYDRAFLEKSILFRMSAIACPDMELYLQTLKSSSNELSLLLGQLNNSTSEFFRNPLSFALLEQLFLPRLIDEKQSGNAIRIWSAGCASGPEPYSLAMMLDGILHARKARFTYRIFATDRSEQELELARQGIYDFRKIKNTRLELLEKYFTKSGEMYTINKELKEHIDFSKYDLLDQTSVSPPAGIYGDFDLIMCSNLLFYYRPEFQQNILNKIYRSLKQGGIFVTGEAEIQIVKSFGKLNQLLLPAALFVKN